MQYGDSVDAMDQADQEDEVLEYELRLRFRYLLGLGVASFFVGAISWVLNPFFTFTAASFSMAAACMGPLRDPELREGLGGRSVVLIGVAVLGILTALAALALRVFVAWSPADF